MTKDQKSNIDYKELAEKYLDLAGTLIVGLDAKGTISLLNKKVLLKHQLSNTPGYS